MHPRRAHRSLLAPLALALACGGAATETKPEATPAAEAEATPANKAAEAEPDTAEVKPDNETPAVDFAKHAARREETRTLVAAYAAGELGDRLKEGNFLLVDAKPAKGTAMVHYYLYAGAVEPGKDMASLKAAKGADDSAPMSILLGGKDSERPVLFRDIAPGSYTACALASSLADPEERRVTAEVAAEFEAKPDYKLSPESLKEGAAEVERRLGRPLTKPSFDKSEALCAGVTVSDDAASRVLVLGG